MANNNMLEQAGTILVYVIDGYNNYYDGYKPYDLCNYCIPVVKYLPELFKRLRMVVQTSTDGSSELRIFIDVSKLEPFNQFISNSTFNCMIL